jgi:hypothetical protein
MKSSTSALAALIAALAVVAASVGIFSEGGPGPFEHESIRGQTVAVYGRGVYRHMSAEVAPQGIAQDYVTLLVAVPTLLASLAWARRGSLAGRVLLAGTVGYFLVTYLFNLVMAMYNGLFLVYVALLGSSFFTLASVLPELARAHPGTRLRGRATTRHLGVFLVVTAGVIALLWLSVVVPPLANGAVIPSQVEHYTTLVVQGLDLGLLLPLGMVGGVLLLRDRPLGYVIGPVYVVFLAMLMTALTAKVASLGRLGFEIVPAILIIPTLNLVAVALTVRMLAALATPRRAASGA